MFKFNLSTYFLTENGRKYSYFSAIGLAAALFGGNFLPHTLLLNKYREIITFYKSGIEEPVPEKLKNIIDVAYEKLGIHPYYTKLIKPFTVYGFDVFEGGSTRLRFGCAIGIPKHFHYESKDHIDKQLVRFRNEPISWNSENGQLLEQSLVLTDNEKLFAICKAILQLETHRVFLNAAIPTFSFVGTYAICVNFNQKLNLYARPFQVRMVLYSIMGLFGLGICTFLKDFNQVSYDTEIDKKLSELGPEFISAGISYYNKLLQRNIALRNLLKNDAYTSKGNENYYLRQKHLPITFRQAYFKSRLEELKQKNNDSTEPIA